MHEKSLIFRDFRVRNRRDTQAFPFPVPPYPAGYVIFLFNFTFWSPLPFLASAPEERKTGHPDFSRDNLQLVSRIIFLLFQSGRRVSNPQPPAWKAGALPIELLPQSPSKPFGEGWV